jgi:hypothetical protein
MRGIWWVAAVCACAVQVELPPAAQIECAADDDCPDDYVCKVALGRCFPPASATLQT